MEPNLTDDRVLVEQAQQGRLDAFEELVRRYQRPVYRYLWRMCRNEAQAVELSQDTFVRAWSGLAGFERRASFKNWLFRIATNRCLNELTRGRTYEALADCLPGPSRFEPDQVLRQKARSDSIRQALEQLPAEQRSALMMSIYEEMSYAQIAEVLDKPVTAVNALLYRARMAMRRALGTARALV